MKKLKTLARRFGFARALCFGLVALLVAVRLADPLPLEELRVRTFDLFQVIRPRVAEARPVIIVDIDEKSLARFGQWPWPRTRVADLVATLTKLGAVVIGFDVIFPEPDRLSPGVAVNGFRNLDEATRNTLLALPSNDQVFADALHRAPTVLGESGLPFANHRPAGDAQAPLGIATLGDDPTPFLLTFPGLLRNLPELGEAASGRGVFTIKTEHDGIVRRVPMVMQAQGDIVPSLTLEMLRVVTASDTLLIKTDPAGIKSVAVKGLEVSTDRNGQIWVHFAPHDPARFVSASDVLDGRVTEDAISHKLVLIGTSAVGLLDVKTTPIDPVIPGVEVHAQVLESALTGGVLSQPGYGLVLELAAAILLGIAIIWLAPILNPIVLLGFGAAIVGALVATSWYLFVTRQLLIDFTYPLLSSLLVYLSLVFSSYVREQSQRRRIRSAFSQYISPALVEQLVQSPEKLILGGVEREMSIMFSDVRGFTGISESYKHDPQGLTTLMNRLLTPLTNAILDNRGTIDKYMGDAIMAFWNAPLDDTRHQANACAAAFGMLARVDALNQAREQEAHDGGKPYIPLDVGIGINTGRCVVGNMGSDLRFDYSVLGDSVNLASRLEGQAKTYGVKVVLGDATARAVASSLAVIEIDLLQVKGKSDPEPVWTLVGSGTVRSGEDFQRLAILHADMLSRFRSRDFVGAAETIERCETLGAPFGLKTLYSLYRDRIAIFRGTPPPADWSGVFSATTK